MAPEVNRDGAEVSQSSDIDDWGVGSPCWRRAVVNSVLSP